MFLTRQYKDWVRYFTKVEKLSVNEITNKLKDCTCVMTDSMKNAAIAPKMRMLRELKKYHKQWKKQHDIR
jgi:hypothetical protein